jgi:hypothetical protein
MPSLGGDAANGDSAGHFRLFLAKVCRLMIRKEFFTK